MLSSCVQLIGFGLFAYGINLEAGPGWGLIAGGLAVLFMGHFVDDHAATQSVRVGWFRVGNLLRKWKQNTPKQQVNLSPHPPLIISPEREAEAKRLAEKRLKRGDGRVNWGARR